MEEISQDLRSTIRNESPSEMPQNNNNKKNSLTDPDQHKNKKNKNNPQHAFAVSERYTNRRLATNKKKSAAFMSLHGLPPFPSTAEESTSPNGRKHNQFRDSDIDADVPPINRLHESCALFRIIVENPLFVQTSFILFLNKTDILEEKIRYSPLSSHFPDFDGPHQDPKAAQEFILNLYLDCFERMKNRNRSLYTHFTCATDTNNIRFVFAAVKDMILQSYLLKYNLV